MLDIENIQEQAASMIRNISYLADVTVLEDDGFQNDAAEKARRETGAVILVRQPESLNLTVNSNGISFGSANLIVMCSYNQEVNLYGAGSEINANKATRLIKEALEAYDAAHGSQYFSVQSDQLIQNEGLYERQLSVNAWVTA